MKNHYVTKLDLSHNKLGDEGAVIIADVLRLNNVIHWLNLSFNLISDIGGISLAAAFTPTECVNGVSDQ